MAETALAIARDHPAYEGHFPGRPILPAVVLLAEVLAVLEAATGGELAVAHAKFASAVEPGMPLALSHEALEGGAIRFEVRGPRGVVASGRLAPREGP